MPRCRGRRGRRGGASNKVDFPARDSFAGSNKEGHKSVPRNSETNYEASHSWKRGRGSPRGAGFRGGNQARRPLKREHSCHSVEGKRQKLEVGPRLKEVEVGITEYLGKHEGFSGVVKERYTDFHVNEIDLDGKVAKLTTQEIPSMPGDADDIQDLKETIPQNVWDQLEMLMEADSQISSVEFEVTDMNKAERRAIHVIAKKIPNVISQTVEQGEKKMIVVARSNKQKMSGHKLRKDQRVDWSRLGGSYCHFLLHKVNMDTMDALNQLAVFVRVRPNMLNYAGTKDRRARTTQWISVKKVNPIDLLNAGKAVRGAYLGNFKFAKEPLKLGMLGGNRFRIALRNISGSDEQIENAMISLRDNGFINYYGLQRFGTVAAIPTHDIGKALLQGKWHEAIDFILKPRAGEKFKDLSDAREIYQNTKDALAAYQRIGRPDKIEAKLLKGLHQCGKSNPQGALDWIPRNTRLMYMHAYQSYVWNCVVSRRIREFGAKPIVGDLVYETRNVKQESLDYPNAENDDEEEGGKLKEEDESENNEDNAKGDKIVELKKERDENDSLMNEIKKEVKDESDTAAIKTEKKDIESEDKMTIEETDDNADNTEKNSDVSDDTKMKENNGKENISESQKDDPCSFPSVKILTEEDLPNYTLADIIMPQPGRKVTYPTYAKQWFDEILAKDELTTDLNQNNKKYTLGGAYRKILEIPSDISWRVMRYKERLDDLILCDVDEMRGVVPPKDEPEGKYKALIVEMSLQPSTYATMALREILKCDTSAETQAEQSAAHKAQEEEAARIKSEEEHKNGSEEDKNPRVTKEEVVVGESAEVMKDEVATEDEKGQSIETECSEVAINKENTGSCPM